MARARACGWVGPLGWFCMLTCHRWPPPPSSAQDGLLAGEAPLSAMPPPSLPLGLAQPARAAGRCGLRAHVRAGAELTHQVGGAKPCRTGGKPASFCAACTRLRGPVKDPGTHHRMEAAGAACIPGSRQVSQPHGYCSWKRPCRVLGMPTLPTGGGSGLSGDAARTAAAPTHSRQPLIARGASGRWARCRLPAGGSPPLGPFTARLHTAVHVTAQTCCASLACWWTPARIHRVDATWSSRVVRSWGTLGRPGLGEARG